MRTGDFDYRLPGELIAQHPPAERGASRLLHLDGETGELVDRVFTDLPALIGPRDLVVVNDTAVIKARLLGTKDTGGAAEVMVERTVAEREALAFIRASHAPRPGAKIVVGNHVLTVLERDAGLFRIAFDAPVFEVLQRHGHVPLPPYIARPDAAGDEMRYQTVYASKPGAVAAPTAGLHFDDAMLARLRAAGAQIAPVTLHVGAGTFQPVRVENVEDHHMHSERYVVPAATVDAIEAARASGGRVLAVGTTSLRALESVANDGDLAAGEGETDLFITPGFRFRVVDRLLTNFHLPCSTLLMLVSAFGGVENIRRAYAHAVREKYRFFSYGDAMLIEHR